MNKILASFEDIVSSCNGLGAELVIAAISTRPNEPAIQIGGDLEAFFRAANALDSKVVFVQTHLLEEDVFDGGPPNGDEFSEDAEQLEENIDLRDIDPRLRVFQELVGKPWFHELTVLHEGKLIQCLAYEPRFAEFDLLLEAAEENARDAAGSVSAAREAERRSAEEHILAKLRELRGNAHFMQRARSSKTIRALVVYVREITEDANLLAPAVLNREVAALRDLAMLE